MFVRSSLFIVLLRSSFFIYLLSSYSIHYYEWDIEVCRDMYFSLQFCQFLLHLFWWTVIRRVNVYNCYIFLQYWTLIKYIMSFFGLATFLILRLFYISVATSALLWLLFAWNIFFHFFTSSLGLCISNGSLLDSI